MRCGRASRGECVRCRGCCRGSCTAVSSCSGSRGEAAHAELLVRVKRREEGGKAAPRTRPTTGATRWTDGMSLSHHVTPFVSRPLVWARSVAIWRLPAAAAPLLCSRLSASRRAGADETTRRARSGKRHAVRRSRREECGAVCLRPALLWSVRVGRLTSPRLLPFIFSPTASGTPSCHLRRLLLRCQVAA